MQLSLPPEIILNIIDHIIPYSKNPPIAFGPRHPTTKTLLSLALTSRATSAAARRLLYTYCMYIHTSQRLSLLLNTLQKSSSPLEALDLLPRITSLYLRPFPLPNESRNAVLDIPVAVNVTRLIDIIRPYLRRLLVDMPTRDLDNNHDGGIDSISLSLRSAFTNLPVLREFCSVRDDFWLTTTVGHDEPAVCACWPNLNKLALYNPDVSPFLLRRLCRLENIETVVATRSGGQDQIDMQSEWKKMFPHPDDVRPMRMVFVNVEVDHRRVLGRDNWKEVGNLMVEEVNVPISYYGDEDYIILCQQWVKRNFMTGKPVEYWT